MAKPKTRSKQMRRHSLSKNLFRRKEDGRNSIVGVIIFIASLWDLWGVDNKKPLPWSPG
jgi:hypothetical protein